MERSSSKEPASTDDGQDLDYGNAIESVSSRQSAVIHRGIASVNTNTNRHSHSLSPSSPSTPSASLSLLVRLFLLVILSTMALVGQANAQQPAMAARHSIGLWEEDIGYFQSFSVSLDSPILTHVSKYQSIEVHVSKYYGKILLLDNVVQLTERDADSYNEMMAHMPMMQHPNPKRALIIGGGDGYILSEVCAFVCVCVCCCYFHSTMCSLSCLLPSVTSCSNIQA